MYVSTLASQAWLTARVHTHHHFPPRAAVASGPPAALLFATARAGWHGMPSSLALRTVMYVCMYALSQTGGGRILRPASVCSHVCSVPLCLSDVSSRSGHCSIRAHPPSDAMHTCAGRHVHTRPSPCADVGAVQQFCAASPERGPTWSDVVPARDIRQPRPTLRADLSILDLGVPYPHAAYANPGTYICRYIYRIVSAFQGCVFSPDVANKDAMASVLSQVPLICLSA